MVAQTFNSITAKAVAEGQRQKHGAKGQRGRGAEKQGAEGWGAGGQRQRYEDLCKYKVQSAWTTQ